MKKTKPKTKAKSASSVTKAKAAGKPSTKPKESSKTTSSIASTTEYQVPTSAQVKAEIEILKDYRERVRPESTFGDNHIDAIDAQITVLTELLDEDEAEERFRDEDEDSTNNVRDAALDAVRWHEGDWDEEGSLSDGWKSLLLK